MSLSLSHSAATTGIGGGATAPRATRKRIRRTKSRVKCCIIGCQRREGDVGFSFHRFPTDPTMRAHWINAINQPGFYPSQSTRICSRHFTRHSFVSKDEGHPRHPSSRRRLYPNALPSVFIFSTTSSVAPGRLLMPLQCQSQSDASVTVLGIRAPPIVADEVHDHISLISESADDSSRQIGEEDPDYSAYCSQPSAAVATKPAVPSPASALTAAPNIGAGSFALLHQIVRVAVDVDEAQSQLLRELGRLSRKQKRQEALLSHMVDQLTRIVDQPADSELN